MPDIRQSESYAKYLKSLGWTVERIGEINYFIKKIPIFGSILKLQRPDEIRMDTIKELCRKYGVFQIIIEPKTELDAKYLASTGFKLAKSTYLPSKTLQIDLTQSEEKIYTNFSKDCKYSIRKAERAIAMSERSEAKGRRVTIKESSTPEEIKKWHEAWKKSVKFNRYVPGVLQLFKLKKAFPDNRSLFLASHNISGSVIGGALFTTSFHERSNYIIYYWQAFTNKEGRSTLSQYSLLYQGILWAIKHGYKVFDFEGIYDPRFPNKSWLGFTHFKRSFGGYEVEYPGCYTKFRFPL
jgi:lipid II:glycine glycyltransferase (peptidoglycan interpeptide bridge formation enzyme)